MSTTQSTPSCPECGPVPAHHFMLWIDGASDTLSAHFPLHKLPFYAFFMRLTDILISATGRALLFIGSALHLVTFSRDPETAASNRSKLLWTEALRRGMDVTHIQLLGKPTDTFRIRHAGKTHYFTSLPLAPKNHALRMDDKVLFKQTLTAAGLPVPKSAGVTRMRDAERAFEEFSLVCVKPRTGSNGRHTYPHVRTIDELRMAFANVRQISPSASVEEHIEGNLCRATCVDGTLVGFLESAYPWITGDGTSTIEELVAAANTKKMADIDDIVLDASVLGYIARRGYNAQSVLPDGEKLQLTYRGGTGAGGHNREHGRAIHPSFIEPIEHAARLTELHIVGFDIIIPDPQLPADSQRWGFIEANSLPWTDLHATPYFGDSIDLSPAIWDAWLSRYGT